MTATQDQVTTTSWDELRNEARQIRDSANRLVSLVDEAVQGAGSALEAEFEQIRERILQSVAPGAVRQDVPAPRPAARKASTTPRTSTRFRCEICAGEGHRYRAKNQAGLSIHMGRVHGKKADREKAAAAEAEAMASEPTVSAMDTSGGESDESQ